jgi:anaerobic ribonucleoside-triphosphate reductase activating protein
VDYTGFSVVLAVSGCNHKCDGCWAKDSWKRTAGKAFTEDTYQELKNALNHEYMDNLVLQGGDPLFSANRSFIMKLCTRIKAELPDKSIILFTGYTIGQIERDLTMCNILDCVDVIIDGKYDKTATNVKTFRGSDNQGHYKILKGMSIFVD